MWIWWILFLFSLSESISIRKLSHGYRFMTFIQSPNSMIFMMVWYGIGWLGLAFYTSYQYHYFRGLELVNTPASLIFPFIYDFLVFFFLREATGLGWEAGWMVGWIGLNGLMVLGRNRLEAHAYSQANGWTNGIGHPVFSFGALVD